MSTPPVINTLPAAPSRSDAPDVFVGKANAFLGALPPLSAQQNSLAQWINGTAGQVEQNAIAASASSASAVAAANYKGEWSSLSGALNIPATVVSAGQLWMLLESVLDVTTEVPGVSVVWSALSAVGVARFTVVNTGINYSANNREWINVTGSGVRVTLPTTPVVGAEIAVAVNENTNIVLDLNGQKFRGEDVVEIELNKKFVEVGLIYISETVGWRFA